MAIKPFSELHQSSINSLRNTLILNVCSGVLKILSSNAPITDLLLSLFGLKSATVCQALAKADTVSLTKSHDSRSTTSTEIEQLISQDAIVSHFFGLAIHEKLFRLPNFFQNNNKKNEFIRINPFFETFFIISLIFVFDVKVMRVKTVIICGYLSRTARKESIREVHRVTHNFLIVRDPAKLSILTSSSGVASMYATLAGQA